MSEIKTNKVVSALNPSKVTFKNGISVVDSNSLSDRNKSFGVNENGQIEIFKQLSVSTYGSVNFGEDKQVLISRGIKMPPVWARVPPSPCPPLQNVGTAWAIGVNDVGSLARSDTSTPYNSTEGEYTVQDCCRIGFGTTNFSGYGSPKAIPGENIDGIQDKNWYYISKSGFYAIKTDGTLWSWGSSCRGRLGTGFGFGAPNNGCGNCISPGDNCNNDYKTGKSKPQRIGTASDWIQVSGSLQGALKTDGTIWVWGDGEDGRRGDGIDNTNSIVWEPVPLQNNSGGYDSDWIFLSDNRSGVTKTFKAIKNNRTLWSWGKGGEPAHGFSSSSSQILKPTQVGTDTDWVYVSGSKGIKANGSLWSWGRSGSVGDGRITGNQTTPKQISSDKWLKVVETDPAGGSNSVWAIKQDGTLWAWGWNFSGRYLGVGETDPQQEGYGWNQSTPPSGKVNFVKSPIQVGEDSDWVDVVPGSVGAMLLKSNGTIWWVGTGYSITGCTNCSSTTQADYAYTPRQPTNFKNISISSLGYYESFHFQFIAEEIAAVPESTMIKWIRRGFTSLKNTPCVNPIIGYAGLGSLIGEIPPPTGYKYADGSLGTINMKSYFNALTGKLDWPPVDGTDGCGDSPQNLNGTIDGQITYIQKTT